MLPRADITAVEVRECAEVFFQCGSAEESLRKLELYAVKCGCRIWSYCTIGRIMERLNAEDEAERKARAARMDLPLVGVTEAQWLDHLMIHMPSNWGLDICEQILKAQIVKLGYTEIDAWTIWHGTHEFFKQFMNNNQQRNQQQGANRQ